MKIPLGVGAYSRPFGKLPAIRCENRFFEQNPIGAENVALLSRPGSTRFLEIGDGPIRTLYSQYGVFNGDLFFVSGTELYRHSGGQTTPIDGALSDIDFPVIASVAIPGWEALFITDGLTLQYYDGLQAGVHELKPCSVPDDVPISDLAVLASHIICVQKRSRKFFWIRPGETDIADGDFSSAEAEPDEIVSVVAVGDQLWFFGQSSMEPWYATGDNEQPFAPVQGRAFSLGLLPGTLAKLQDTIVIVGQDRVSYRIAGSPERISNHGIEEILRDFVETTDVSVTIDFQITSELNVQFFGSAATASPVINYAWDFGDGETLSGLDADPIHIYDDFGDYTVTLRVTNEDGTVGVAQRLVTVVSIFVAPTNFAGVWSRLSGTLEQIALSWNDPNDYVATLPRKVYRNAVEIADLAAGVVVFAHDSDHATVPLGGEVINDYTVRYYAGVDLSPAASVSIWSGPPVPTNVFTSINSTRAYEFFISWTGGLPIGLVTELYTDYLCFGTYVLKGTYARSEDEKNVRIGTSALITASSPEIQYFHTRIRSKLTSFAVDDFSDYVFVDTEVEAETGETDGYQTCPP